MHSSSSLTLLLACYLQISLYLMRTYPSLSHSQFVLIAFPRPLPSPSFSLSDTSCFLTHTHIRTHMHIHTYTYMHTHIYIFTHTCTYTHKDTHTKIHTRTHTHTHTNTPSLTSSHPILPLTHPPPITSFTFSTTE